MLVAPASGSTCSLPCATGLTISKISIDHPKSDMILRTSRYNPRTRIFSSQIFSYSRHIPQKRSFDRDFMTFSIGVQRLGNLYQYLTHSRIVATSWLADGLVLFCELEQKAGRNCIESREGREHVGEKLIQYAWLQGNLSVLSINQNQIMVPIRVLS